MRKKLLFLLPCIALIIGSTNAQNALNFDGTNDFVQTNYSGVLASSDRTFEAWVNVSSSAPSSNLTILDYGLNAVGSRNTFLVDANRGIRFVSGGTNANISSTSGAVTPGQWAHVAFVMNSGTGFLYVNGVQVGTGSLTTVNTPSGNANVTIGQRVSGGSIPFEGNIDEVRIWDVARTPSEIMANMNAELCSYPSSLKAYYKFNQGVAGSNNVGLTNVVGAVGTTAVATNFAMTGTTSNWVSGTVITSITPLNLSVSVDTANQVVTSLDTSANVSYQWYDCTISSILPGDTNRIYTSRSGGTFAVILSNGTCTDTSACFVVSAASGGPIPGEALHFDGTDDFIQTTYAGILDSANRTFEAWINVSPTAPSSNLSIVDYGVNAVGSRNTFMVNGGKGLSFISGGTNANMGTAAGIIPAGQWTHVAFVLDNDSGYIYVNGLQAGTGNLSSVNTPSGGDSLRIGQRVSGGSIPFSGEIDEVRIWDVARTQAEIMADMNTKFCGPVAGLSAYYLMNIGVAGGNNSALVKVFNPINSGDGFLTNFALTGASSNFVSPGAMLNAPVIDTTVSLSGITITANDTTVDSYHWINCTNNMLFPLDTLISFMAPASGDYAVILTKNGCADTSACITVIGVGLDKFKINNNFSLSQNPVTNSFELINDKGSTVNTYLRSINGRMVEMKQNVSENRIRFNIEDAKPGVYFLTVEGEDGFKANFKIIKQ